jgi:hypothetical protein
VYPPVCDVTYECISVEGDDADVTCEIPDVSFFESVTTEDGQNSVYFNFGTYRNDLYDPGTYKFTIQGTTGSETPITATSTFTLTLEDPCPAATIQLLANPFDDQLYHYREDPIRMSYSILKRMAVIESFNACGDLAIEFKQLV